MSQFCESYVCCMYFMLYFIFSMCSVLSTWRHSLFSRRFSYINKPNQTEKFNIHSTVQTTNNAHMRGNSFFIHHAHIIIELCIVVYTHIYRDVFVYELFELSTIIIIISIKYIYLLLTHILAVST